MLKQVPITLILESLCVRVHERAIAEHSLKHCVTLNIKVPLTNTNQIKSVSQIIWFTKDHESNLSSPRQPFCSNPDHIYIYIFSIYKTNSRYNVNYTMFVKCTLSFTCGWSKAWVRTRAATNDYFYSHLFLWLID